MRIQRRNTDFKSSLLTVTDGTTTAGFIISRGRQGHEAFDSAGRSIGVFPTQREAVRAIPHVEAAR